MLIELNEVDSDTTRKIVLDKLPVMIGQGPDAGIHVDDNWASRRHCEINSIKGTLVVRDLGSMLGTFVNGLNVNTAELMPGDRLTVGGTSFQVLYERRIQVPRKAEPLPSPPPEPPSPEEAKPTHSRWRFLVSPRTWVAWLRSHAT